MELKPTQPEPHEQSQEAVMQKAEITSLDALRAPPFSTIGDPEKLFAKPELSDLFELVKTLAA